MLRVLAAISLGLMWGSAIASYHHKLRVMLIGDSISYMLEKSEPIEKTIPVKMVGLTGNCTAFGGFDAEDLFQIVDKVVALPRADVVLVQAGTNNLLHHYARPEGMKELLDAVRKRFPKAPILVMPVLPSRRFSERDRRTWNEATKQIISKMQNASFLPECELSSNDYVPDGVHLTKAGYRKLRNAWIAGIDAVAHPNG